MLSRFLTSMCLFWASIGSKSRCVRGSGVSSLFWRTVVEVDDVEQMNKKVDRLR